MGILLKHDVRYCKGHGGNILDALEKVNLVSKNKIKKL
jgi:hypothetical protein